MFGADAHFLHAHQRRRRHARLVTGALCTVAAILGAAAGLDAKKRAALDVSDFVVRAMNFGGAKDQLGERQIVDGLQICKRPHRQILSARLRGASEREAASGKRQSPK